MSLPWFPFHVAPYTGDTMHLTTEEHGAYLLLILAYYASERPLPASDRALASITKLPIQRWKECRDTLEPFFRSTGTVWIHDRCELEIHERTTKHTKNKSSGQAGGEASAKRRSGKPQANATVQANPPATKRSSERSSERLPDGAATVEPRSTHLHLQEQVEEREGSYEPSGAAGGLDGFGSVISPDWALTSVQTKLLLEDGYRADQIVAGVDRFKRTKVNDGSISIDWDRSWRNWWDSNKPPLHPNEKPKKAPPRVEVSRAPRIRRRGPGAPLPADWQPSVYHAQLAAKEGLDLDRVATKFRNYCEMNPDAYSKHNAAFSNWLLDRERRKGDRLGQTPSRSGSITDAAREAIASIDGALAEAESRDRSRAAAVPVLSQDGLREPEGGFGVDGDGADGVFASDRE